MKKSFLFLGMLAMFSFASAEQSIIPMTVVNPGFEDGLTNWSDDANTSLVTTDAYEGSNSLRLGPTDAGRSQQITGWEVGDTLVLTCYGKNEGTPGIAWFKGYSGIEFRNDEGRISYHATNYPTGTEWEKLTVTAIVPEGATVVNIGSWLESGGDPTTVLLDAYTLDKLKTLPPDTEAPSAPAALTSANIMQTAFDLTWVPSTDDMGVAGYVVYIDGDSVASSMTNSISIADLTCGTKYLVTVAAYDAAMNYSDMDTVNVKTAKCKEYNEIEFALVDPSFEEGGAAWEDWGNAVIVDTTSSDGSKSLLLGGVGGDGGRGQAITGWEVGDVLKLTVDGKRNGVPGIAWYKGYGFIDFRDVDAKRIAAHATQPAGMEWGQLSVTVEIPEGAASVAVGNWLESGGDPTTVSLDNYRIVKLVEKPAEQVLVDYDNNQISENTNRSLWQQRGDLWARDLGLTGLNVIKVSMVPASEAPAGYNLTDNVLKIEAKNTPDWDGVQIETKNVIALDSAIKYLHVAYFVPEKPTFQAGNMLMFINDTALMTGTGTTSKTFFAHNWNAAVKKPVVAGVWYDEVFLIPGLDTLRGKPIGHLEPYFIPKNATSYMGSIVMSASAEPRFVNTLALDSVKLSVTKDSVEILKTLQIKTTVVPKYATNPAVTWSIAAGDTTGSSVNDKGLLTAGASNGMVSVIATSVENTDIADTITIKVYGEVTGINDAKAISFSVAPNPASSVVTISGVPADAEVSVVSLDGNVVKQVNGLTIDVSNLSKGIYLVKVKTINGVGVNKLVVE